MNTRIGAIFAALTCLPLGAGNAAVIVGGFNVIDTFNFVDSREANDSGATAGTRESFGLDVTPVGSQPVTAQDGTSVIATQGPVKVTVPYLFSPALPNQFFVSIGTLLTGTWTLSLSNPSVNGGTIATLPIAAMQTTTPPPFVSNVTLSSNGLTPTINWVLPQSDPATSQTVYVIDRSVVTPDGHPVVYTSQSFAATQTNFAIPSGVLVADHQYTFAVQEDVRSGPALIARSRSYVDFVQNDNLPPGTILQLPVVKVVGSSPVYSFNFPVGPGQIYYLDPVVTKGYLYQTGDGDPLFASVSVPSLGAGVTYTLCLPQGGGFVCDTTLMPDQTFDFAGAGVSAFEILLNGIELDPLAGLPFDTAVTFEGDGRFTGSITTLVSSVPEPGSLAILALSISGLMGLRGRRSGRPTPARIP